MSTSPQDALAGFDGIRVRMDDPGSGNKGKFVNLAVEEQLIRLLAAGMRMNDAARQLQLSNQRASQIMRRPTAMARLMEINKDVYAELDAELKFRARQTHEKLHQAADEALDKVIDLMRDADSQTIQFKAAQDLLDRRQDTSKVHRVDKRVAVVNIDAKWLESAAAVDQEEGKVING